MKLSIIVPILNEVAEFPDLLMHLLQWQRRGCEIVLADGGSVDGSVEIAQAMGSPVIVAPQGRAQQMNADAERAQGDVLLFLHADTRLPADALASIRIATRAGYRVWGRFDVRITGGSGLLTVIGRLMNLRSRWSAIATGDQAIFVLRRTFRDLGGFADLPLMEDVELSRRLRKLSPPACLGTPVTTSGRRWDTNGIWRTIWLMWRLRWAYWRGVPAERLAGGYR
jgi:rSAM/selenodomain-associated transferase 2